MSELDGFVVVKRNAKQIRNEISIRVDGGMVRFSAKAMRVLGNPTYINIFFDERQKRMLIVNSAVENENTFKLVGGGKCDHSKCINSDRLVRLVRNVAEVNDYANYLGHLVDGCDDKVIFDLSKPLNRCKGKTNFRKAA